MSLANWLKDVIPALASSRLQEWMFQRDAFVPVFMLHRVEDPALGVRGHTLPRLERQLAWLRKHRWELISLETLAQRWDAGAGTAARTAVFTIDDGYLDQYTLAEQLFDHYDCPVTYFATTDFLDGNIWLWDAQLDYLFHRAQQPLIEYRAYQNPDNPQLQLNLSTPQTTRQAFRQVRELLKRLPQATVYTEVARISTLLDVELPAQPPPAFAPMNWDQAADLERRGHTVAPHSCTHRMLSRLAPEDARQEIIDSWRTVESRMGRTPQVFAYPNGMPEDFSATDTEVLRTLGCQLAVSTRPGHAHPQMLAGAERFAVPRFSVPDDMAYFCQYVSWIEQFKDRFRNSRGRAVAVGS